MLIPTLLLTLAASAGEDTIATETQPFELILWLDHFDYVTGVPDTTTWSTMTPEGIDTIINYHARCGKATVAFRDFAGGLIRRNSELELGRYPLRIDKRRGWDTREYSHHIHYGEAPDDVMTSVVNSCRKCVTTTNRRGRPMASRSRSSPIDRETSMCDRLRDLRR